MTDNKIVLICLATPFVLAIPLGIFVILFMSSDPSPTKTATFPTSGPGSTLVFVGQRGVVNSGATKTLLTVSKDDSDELERAQMARDTQGILQMMTLGKVFMVDQNTPVLVIDRSFSLRRVRVETTGESGWLVADRVCGEEVTGSSNPRARPARSEWV